MATLLARRLRLVLFAILLCPAPAVAQGQTFTLTINKAGSSTGTVGVVPTGALCSTGPGTSCDVSIASGSVVTLSANSLSGSSTPPGVFSAGSGSAAACATSTCTFTMNADSSVTATFDPANGPIVTVTLTLAGLLFFLVGLGVKAQQLQPVTGAEGMIGEVGRALTAISPGEPGSVAAHGEIWRATAAEPIAEGDAVRIVAIRGLTLEVRPA
jgi:membrane protein implicated in regulation of membrane protease activity